MRYEINNHEVLSVTEQKGLSGKIHIIKKYYTMVKHIKLSEVNGLITANIISWQGEELPFEPIQIKLSGDVEEQIIELTEEGLQLEGTGLNIVVESIEEKMLNDKIEVML